MISELGFTRRKWVTFRDVTDGSVPNTLVIANCEVVKPRVTAAEHISQFNEEVRSPFVKKYKTLIHPGEVNRIRGLPQNPKIVATHTWSYTFSPRFDWALWYVLLSSTAQIHNLHGNGY
ncbi:hypothetical protein J1N35_035481 [Gossypium stocksii]|uniref:Uncharacterized protein n=1 Tax=Gossypium stocksii TaxID=47602 RepID=A0A9D3UUC7_9ROSI|nr:hypothetical protein J1N35_035481 [Gossypium stocksii]